MELEQEREKGPRDSEMALWTEERESLEKMVKEGNGVVKRGQMRSHRAGCTFLRV